MREGSTTNSNDFTLVPVGRGFRINTRLSRVDVSIGAVTDFVFMSGVIFVFRSVDLLLFFLGLYWR